MGPENPANPPLQHFSSLVQQNEEPPLLEAVITIAQEKYPDVDVQQLLGMMDRLLSVLRSRLSSKPSRTERAYVLDEVFYGELGFGGNVGKAWSPDQIYLNTVLETRRGDCLSLGILWMELAQGIGLDARGVMVPGAGYFVVKVVLDDGEELVIDPLSGRPIDHAELSVMTSLQPYQDDMDAEPVLDPHLKAATSREILGYMLQELKEIYQSRSDGPSLVAILDRLIILQPDAWTERRDRGLAHAECGDAEQAVTDLEAYISHVTDGEDIPQIVARIQDLKSRKTPGADR